MNSAHQPVSSSLQILCVFCVSALSFFIVLRASSNALARAPQESAPFHGQSQEEADRKSSRLYLLPHLDRRTYDAPHENRPSWLHGLSRGQLLRLGGIRQRAEFSRMQFRKRKISRSPT